MRKFINIFIVCIFLFSSLCAGAPVLGAPIQPEIFEVPKGVYVFRIDKDGVLGYQYDDSMPPPKTHLLKSKNLTSKFTPIDTFEYASPIMSTFAHLPNAPVFVYGRIKGKENFAIYVLRGNGEIVNEVPGTGSSSPDPPFIVVPDILSSSKCFVIRASQQGAGYLVSLQKILLTKDGGKSFREISLPGKTPEDVEGILFNPENMRELWVWRSSMGNWGGVKHSTDGGISWQYINTGVEGNFYRCMYNPITKELVILQKNPFLIIVDNKGKSYNFKGNFPSKVSKVHSYVRVLFFDKETKSVIIPIFWYEDSGKIIGEIYSYSNGNCEKIADAPEVEGEAVHGGFISSNTFFLSFVNFKGNGKVIVYTLNKTEIFSKFKTFSLPLLIVLILCILMFWKLLRKNLKAK